MYANVLKWLDDSAMKYPDKMAIYDEVENFTYKQYHDKAIGLAEEICNRKIGPKKPVVVYLEKSVKELAAFMGIAYSGNFYSPIDIEMPEQRVNKILEVLSPELVITTEELKKDFENFDYNGEFLIYEEVVPKESSEVVQRATDKIIDTDLLYVLFTSGSTGVPKGVCITHRGVIDYTDWVTETFEITSEDSFGNQAPFYFDNSVLDIYSAMKTGAGLFIIPKNLFARPVKLLEFLKEKNISTIFWVPSALMIVSKLKAFKNVDLSDTLKRVLFAGEVMPTKQLNIWREYLPNLLYANLYGPTEITVDCTYYIVDREFEDSESLPIGIPTKNTDILVLDEKDVLVTEPDVIGELCVRGTSLSTGYYNNPEKTKEAFIQNPFNSAYEEKIYRTGDLVRYNERGELIYVSRKDFQIKHLGHRIELGEIEAAVSAIEKIENCACSYDQEKDKIILFYQGKDIDTKEIRAEIENNIPKYMIPNVMMQLEEMPLNMNGKIDRTSLLGIYKEKYHK